MAASHRRLKKRKQARRPAVGLTRWLEAKGVEWARDAVVISSNVVEGLGCVAQRNIARGEILFVVPKRACMVSRDRGDCQEHLAKIIKSPGSKWRPFVSSLGRAHLPFLWPTRARSLLEGTELEDVVRMKRKRDHDEACAIVLSHLNPFFGSAIVPFSCLLNYREKPNCSFNEERGHVIGRARRSIAKGEELTQAYASSTAEFLYRYGFVPNKNKIRSDDAVSVQLPDLLSAARAKNDRSVVDGLVSSLCLEPNPWDGLEHVLTVELVGPGATGVEKLVAASIALKTQIVVDTNEDDSDLAAARLAGAFLKRKEDEDILKIAREHGGDDGDPWPALLRFVGARMDLSPYRRIARRALLIRKARLFPIEEGDDYYHRCATSLKRVELAIISRALTRIREC